VSIEAVANTRPTAGGGLLRGWEIPGRRDPRWPFAFLLASYLVLGATWFGFNRAPSQVLIILGFGCALEVVFAWALKGRKVLPVSAFISCSSLAILLNYSHGSALLVVPVLLTLGSKYVLTHEGRHVINPSLFGVALSLLLGQEMITAAPAYQWAGSSMFVTLVIIGGAAAFFLHRIGRLTLVVSFVGFYALQTLLRAWIMRHHLPPEMLFIGTMTTPAFFLFTMYMMTDPVTSPNDRRGQVIVAALVAGIDLALHAKESVFTFFYAGLIVAAVRFVGLHLRSIKNKGIAAWRAAELGADRLRAVLLVGTVTAVYVVGLTALAPPSSRVDPGFVLTKVSADEAGLGATMGDLFHRVDPRVRHVAKWVLSVGDGVAVGDADNDGDLDLFLTHVLKRDDDRAGLYLNVTEPNGPLRFERQPVPALHAIAHDPEGQGLISGGVFADIDNDGDQDLVLSVAFGTSRVLESRLVDDGALRWMDVTDEAGLGDHAVSMGVTVFDADNDGDLDLFRLGSLTSHLFGYDTPTPFNLFSLPAPAWDGDRRMLQFMHNSWHQADNGGLNHLFLNDGRGRFTRLPPAQVGITDTRWSLAVTAADLNHDGWTDLYVANDFGPDRLYLHQGLKEGVPSYTSIVGPLFSDVGNDTYKGMNASAADVDRNGYLDVYISNVHHALQAEGSILWMVTPTDDPHRPRFVDEAARRGALNPRRFAWGAQFGDLNLDGWPDLVQANGMLDDRLDPLYDDMKDYWYVNHKLMQSGPELHTYADMWGDIRGREIYPNEARRVLLNRGERAPGTFVDVAAQVGLTEVDNSRAVLLADLDGDGDDDVLICNQHGPTSLYTSDLAQRSSAPASLRLTFVGDGERVNRDGIGTRVTVHLPDGPDGPRPPIVDEVQAMGGFSSQRAPGLTFGLGQIDSSAKIKVTVRWPHGVEERLQLTAGRHRIVLPPHEAQR
jgi:hypothetical protein